MNPDVLTNETTMVEKGYSYLTGDELTQRIVGKTVFGDFGAYFKFNTCFDPDGTAEGKNNAGAHNFGTWKIDCENNTISVGWDSGWESSTTRAYNVDGTLKLYEVNTGQWKTTFSTIIDGCARPLATPV